MSSSDQTITPPRQARSRAALERIYVATNQLLQERPFDRIRMTDIAKRGEVSVGSIYQRFRTKDDLLWHLYGIYVETAAEEVHQLERKMSSADDKARLKALLQLILRLFREHRGIIKSLLLRHRQDPASIPKSQMDVIERVNSEISVYLQATTAKSRTANDATFCLHLILSACRDRILFDDPYGVPNGKAGDRQFIERLIPIAEGILR